MEVIIEPEITITAVKIDKDGNRIPIEITNIVVKEA